MLQLRDFRKSKLELRRLQDLHKVKIIDEVKADHDEEVDKLEIVIDEEELEPSPADNQEEGEGADSDIEVVCVMDESGHVSM